MGLGRRDIFEGGTILTLLYLVLASTGFPLAQAATDVGRRIESLLGRPAEREEAPVFHGYVRSDPILAGAEEPGRIARVLVEPGASVKAGDLLFELDSPLEQAAHAEAKAALAETEARLLRAQSARMEPEEIDVLRAREDSARAAFTFSKREYDRIKSKSAKTDEAKSRRDKAKAQYEGDKARLEEIEQQIAVAEMGARLEDIDAAKAAVTAAKARAEATLARLKRRSLTATAGGVVQEVYYRAGEVVAAGRPIVSLLSGEQMKVRFYVKQAHLPKLAVGQTVDVRCDGCTQTLAAHIRFIAASAEFTPPVIFSNAEREKLVYMVEATAEQPERLRAGQPITVSIAATGHAPAPAPVPSARP